MGVIRKHEDIASDTASHDFDEQLDIVEEPPQQKRSVDDGPRCFCGRSLQNYDTWRPLVRVRFEEIGVAEVADVEVLSIGTSTSSMSSPLCHVRCVRDAIETKAGVCGSFGTLDPPWATSFQALILQSPETARGKKGAEIRLSNEERRIFLAAIAASGDKEFSEEYAKVTTMGWEAPGAPLLAAWSFTRLGELRISSCLDLREIPSDIAITANTLKSLVIISCSLVRLDPAVASLHLLETLFLNGNFLQSIPEEVGLLPVLKEVCLDANRLDALPTFTSPLMTLLTAPGNLLVSVPKVSGKLTRLEVHGNHIESFSLSPLQLPGQWDNMLCLKLMGNKLVELPEEISLMKSLRVFHVAENRLTSLPSGMGSLPRLEWLFAYSNQLTELPSDILWGKWLERLLLEANPLSPNAINHLITGVIGSKVKTLGLDEEQVVRASQNGAFGSTPGLPPAICIGSVVRCEGGGQYFMRLTRASQLRRASGVLAQGEAGGPASPVSAPARLLVVAFAASQGEPEWHGLLRRLAVAGTVSPLRALQGRLSDHMEANKLLASLWSGCSRQGQDWGEVDKKMQLEDFDILSVVDHRMRWYSGARECFHAALLSVTERYERTIFVGASMGGCGALLHGADLADCVLAFGPQATLDESTLRPPAVGLAELRALTQSLQDAVLRARHRGAYIRVHCAADQHFWHALSLPLGEHDVIVHPLTPRKPFARLLDKGGVLVPIVSDAFFSVLSLPATTRQISSKTFAPANSAQEGDCASRCDDGILGPPVAIAHWTSKGGIGRVSGQRTEVLRQFFSPFANVPRPGDWFCPTCGCRNQSWFFFCQTCRTDGGHVSSVANPQAARVVAGNTYPRVGDWGCKKCLAAKCAYDKVCEPPCDVRRDSEDAWVLQG